jgi:hypothetical protein
MSISEERKKRVIDLYYNQGKTTREIAKIERMSIRDISPILREEESKRQRHKDQQQQEEISSKAYELFSEGKRPVEVAISLNLREPEATKLYREYWKLKQLHKLNAIYEEIGDDIRHIIELYRRAKKEGTDIEHIVKLLQLADEDNASGILQLERRYKWLIDKIHQFDLQIERAKNYLYSLNNEIGGAKYSLDYCHDAYERLRQELLKLYEEKNKLKDLLRENNGNYIAE